MNAISCWEKLSKNLEKEDGGTGRRNTMRSKNADHCSDKSKRNLKLEQAKYCFHIGKLFDRCISISLQYSVQKYHNRIENNLNLPC